MLRLFVYGTLAPGRPNHHVLGGIPGTWEAAVLRGRLYDEGWGAALGSPGIVPSPDGEAVEGFVLSSPSLDQHWDMLDAFEGDGYQRVRASVRVTGGRDLDAFVYALRLCND
jgi:gamma-glutamylcyclotransferase (GGCT)/AIG2-like uncharacterized protein YtfP